jgi:hypothetical protein
LWAGASAYQNRRYSANLAALEELLGFLYAECCTRNKAIKPAKIMVGKIGEDII